MRKIGVLFLTAALSLSSIIGLSGCGKNVQLPDLSSLGEIQAISREEGSGTRAEFENMVNTLEKGSDQIAASTDEVVEMVAADENAIGYLAYSSANSASSAKITVLDIEGITVDSKTIRDGSYPLCRNYYLAYAGEISDVERDFIKYIMSAGQDIVGEYAVPVKNTKSFLSDKSKGSIDVAGSSSEAPIVEALAEGYQKYNPNAEFKITVTDSTQGLTAAMRGQCDLAMSSRELKDYESELLTKKAIAKDAIAIAVNSKSPITNLSVNQIRTIYDKECENWQDLK